jgi:hypothetical protein
MPITVPYSLFELAVTAGLKQNKARKARKKRESEDAIRHDLARHGRPDIVVTREIGAWLVKQLRCIYVSQRTRK